MASVPCARRLPALMGHRSAIISGSRTAMRLVARSESTIHNPMPTATTTMPYYRTGGTETQPRFLLKVIPSYMHHQADLA